MSFVHNLNPVALDLGFVQIRWYGIMYVLGFMFAYWYAKKRIREGKTLFSVEQLDSLMAWMTVGVIIGARIVYVIYYNPAEFLANPIDIIAVWKGGLSFHGGLLGCAIAAIIYCRKHKVNFLHFADVISVPAAVANAAGRMGNFFNGELYGPVTDLPWGIVFKEAGELPRHPTMLYEVLYDLALFVVLWQMKDKGLKDGRIFGWFLLLYGIFRSLTELLRVQEFMIGFLTPAQLLNIPVLAVGLWLILRKDEKMHNSKPGHSA